MNPLLYELPLVFGSGVLGSAHCIGMCGAISATMNLGSRGVSDSVMRQLLWSIGRTFTYAFLGMVAGFSGARLSEAHLVASRLSAVGFQAAFAIIAGLLLVIQGMFAAGWIRRSVKPGGGCLTATIFGRFLRSGSRTGVFVAGIMTGFLPCGLVYSFLALAVASTSLCHGPLMMIAFGLGTIPVMLTTGIGLSMASLNLRQRMMKLAAYCVLLTGVLTLSRGLAFATVSPGVDPQEACPFCDAASSENGATPGLQND